MNKSVKNQQRVKVLNKKAEQLVQAQSLYGDDLMWYLQRLTRDVDEIEPEDIMQSVWAGVMKNFKPSQITEKKLLMVKTKQTFLDHIRKRDRLRAKERRFSSYMKACPPKETQPLIFEEGAEDARKLFWKKYEAIDLTEDQKEVVWLHVIELLSFEDIKAVTGIATSTASGWMQLCRKKFRSERVSNPDLFTDIPSCYNVQGEVYDPSNQAMVDAANREPMSPAEECLSVFETIFCSFLFKKDAL